MTQAVEDRFFDNPKVNSSLRAEWDDKTVCELEKLLSDHLHAHFKHAMKTIIGCGYKERDAETIILRSSLFHGGRDIMSSILTGALASVNIDKGSHVAGYHVFENLESLVKYTLLEMICTLKEVKPSLTVLEAMWLIFVWDFNLPDACTKEIGLGLSSQATAEAEPANAKPTPKNSENVIYPIPKSAVKHLVDGSQPTGLTFESAPQLSERMHVIAEKLRDLYQRSLEEENPGCSKKLLLGINKHEMLWQKEFLLEKSYKGRKSKGSMKAKMLPVKSVSGPSGVMMKNTCSKVSKSSGSVCENIYHHKPSSTPLLSVADPPKIVKDTNFDNFSSSEIPSYYAGIPYDTTLKKYIPQDEKDEAILELVPNLQKLQKIILGWTEWANEKIEQGLTVTQKVKTEMKRVQKEKEEAEKSHTNYHEKRQGEIEKQWASAVSHVESTNLKLRGLETENATLSCKMKSAECMALESARDLQKALQQEKLVLKNCGSIDLEKRLLHQEFTSLQRNAADLARKLEKAKVRLKQFEDQWRKENKEKLKYLSEAETFRGRRKQLEALGKEEETAIRERSSYGYQRCREKIKKLEAEISVLKFESNILKTGTLQRKTVVDYGSSSMGSKNTSQYPGVHTRNGIDQQLLVNNFGAIDKKRERECVVCLAEERSVLFLPCAHQVVCTQCSMQHEKEMDECPSCRTPIQRRIQVQPHPSGRS